MMRVFSRDRASQENNQGHGSVASLVAGVLGDVRQLVVQEIELAKDELLEKIVNFKRVAILFGAAGGVLGIAGMLLLIMLVHLLREVSDWPLWACYGAVGGALAMLGWMLITIAKRWLRELSMVPKRTIETVKETTQWLGKQTESLKT